MPNRTTKPVTGNSEWAALSDMKQASLSEISSLLKGELKGDGDILIKGIQALDFAAKDEISFVVGKAYFEKALNCNAAALIISKKANFQTEKPLILVDDPYLAYAEISTFFSKEEWKARGVSSNSHIGENSTVDPNVSVYPCVYIGDNVSIASGVTLYPGVFIGDNVTIDTETILYPNVTVYNGCKIGKRVIIHSGTVIGSDGFGYARKGRMHVKIPQTGIVVIEDDVEIGSNCCVDRAALGKTIIGHGAKIDNLVQIAHNVVIGANTIIVAQVGISGSCKIGENVTIGGQSGFVGHIEIGDGAMIAAQSGVTKSLASGEVVSGTPAITHKHFLRVAGEMKRLPELSKEVRALKEKIEELENKINK